MDTPHLLVFGFGYTTSRLARRLQGQGWRITATARSGAKGTVLLDDPAISRAIATASHIVSSVPPTAGSDPVLDRYSAALNASPARWIGYLSSTGVYGDAGGAWVDETAPLGGQRSDRVVRQGPGRRF